MSKTVPMIGLQPDELRWARLLVTLLRHPDPVVPELTRQALLHIVDGAIQDAPAPAAILNHAG